MLEDSEEVSEGVLRRSALKDVVCIQDGCQANGRKDRLLSVALTAWRVWVGLSKHCLYKQKIMELPVTRINHIYIYLHFIIIINLVVLL